MKVDLIWLSNDPDLPHWPHGRVIQVSPQPGALEACVRMNIDTSDAEAWLFCDSQLGLPDENSVHQALTSGDQVWHAGLKLGTGGKPEFIDFASPTWMLNRDPDPEIEATSWRLSLRACLIRCEVLRQLGGPRDDFHSLEAAGLELGHRYIRNGVFIRHFPQLVEKTEGQQAFTTPVADQLRFVKACYGTRWMNWAALRAFLTRKAALGELVSARKEILKMHTELKSTRFKHRRVTQNQSFNEVKVSVLVPTINRYPYLRVLLGQLQTQSIAPHEILVIDQTPEKERDVKLLGEFPDSPIKWFTLEEAGQCSSRNFGLQNAEGEYVLFLDDDDEIMPDLIERHLVNLQQNRCDVSNGVALEPGMRALPEDFTFLRMSNVFPTNNSMIKKAVLQKSGLFDLAYDHGQRADGDLGMRIYLSGEKMVLNPDISVLHHHAPQGGLRTHKARVKTHYASRQSITLRVLPSVSDIYLAKRFFLPNQVREMLWISVLGTFSLHGLRWKKILKVMVSMIALPVTIMKIRQNCRLADNMLNSYPQIPTLEEKAA